MKKFLTLLLALSLVACMGMSVSAAETFDTDDFAAGNPVSSQVVNINLQEDGSGNTPATVYKVDVEWAGTNLTYTVTNSSEALVWDPVNHVYKVAEGETANGDWGDSKVTATVTNHSNTTVEAVLTGLVTTEGVGFTSNRDDVVLASADEGDSLGLPSAAPAITFEITPTGTPAKDFTINFTITLK